MHNKNLSAALHKILEISSMTFKSTHHMYTYILSFFDILSI